MIALCTFEPSSGFLVDMLSTKMPINAILVQKLTIADLTSIHISYTTSIRDSLKNVALATRHPICIHAFNLNCMIEEQANES